jgi:hypothetical protein
VFPARTLRATPDAVDWYRLIAAGTTNTAFGGCGRDGGEVRMGRGYAWWRANAELRASLWIG